jgi:UPF0176 protein
MTEFVIASLYKFVELSNPQELRAPLRAICQSNGVRGTLLLASEGINGTISGDRVGLENVLAWLRSQVGLEDLDHKESTAEIPPFHRLKVQVKEQIVTLREDDITPTTRVGTYVEPEDWNQLIADPDVVVIDTRNDYEVSIGRFNGAIDPHLQHFDDFPAWAEANLSSERQPKIAMYCTGGIRCEKASSYLLREGFAEVYHLRGGILRYLEKVEEEKSEWDGECFVFDQRVSLDHALKPGDYTLCFGCREPLSRADREHADFELGVCCPHCAGVMNDETKERKRERVRQVALAAKRGERHIGS